MDAAQTEALFAAYLEKRSVGDGLFANWRRRFIVVKANSIAWYSGAAEHQQGAEPLAPRANTARGAQLQSQDDSPRRLAPEALREPGERDPRLPGSDLLDDPRGGRLPSPQSVRARQKPRAVRR